MLRPFLFVRRLVFWKSGSQRVASGDTHLTAYPVADALASRQIPFIFATGYGADALDDHYRHYPRCQKSFNHQALFRTLMSRDSGYRIAARQ